MGLPTTLEGRTDSMLARAKGHAAKGLFERLCGLETWKHWTFGKGDVGGFCQLFFDNVATTLTLTFLVSMNGLGLLQDDEIYNGFLPGLGLTMLFGNVYYSWMAVRLDASQGTQQCTANPYGINTPGAFAFMYSIMLPIAYGTQCPEGMDPTGAECASFKSSETLRIATSANFLNGVFAMLLGVVGPYIVKICPVASLTSALGGIGIGVLGIGQVIYAYEQPLAGMAPLFIMLMLYFSDISTGHVPEAVVIAVCGAILCWADGLTSTTAVADATDVVGWHSPRFMLVSIFEAFPELGPYIGTILPVAITAAANTLMCWRSALKNGDEYSLRETMIADGFGSCLAAIFGCPFGTSVYIGHSAYKKIGARSAYSVLNAVAFLVLTFFGLFKVVGAIIPIEAVAPMNLFVGIMICADAFESVPFRHIPAVIFGLMPSIGDWAKNMCSPSPIPDGTCAANGACGNTAPLVSGLNAFAAGALLVSMIISAILASLCDNKYATAAMWASVAAFFSLFGIIHAPAASVDFENDTPQSQWRYAVGYLIVGGVFVVTFCFQRFTSLVKGPVTEPMLYMSVYSMVQLALDSPSPVEELMGGSRADLTDEKVRSFVARSRPLSLTDLGKQTQENHNLTHQDIPGGVATESNGTAHPIPAGHVQMSENI